MGLAPLIFSWRHTGSARLIRPLPCAGVRSLAKIETRKLEQPRHSGRTQLEAFSLPHAADDRHESRVAWNTRPVPNFSATLLAFWNGSTIGDFCHLDDWSDHRGHPGRFAF